MCLFDGNVKDKSAYGNDGDIIGEIKYVDGIKEKQFISKIVTEAAVK